MMRMKLMYINVLIVMILKMMVKVIVLKIVYVDGLVRLVSITPGHVKLD